MKRACERWASLVDREAIGEVLTDEELRYRNGHPERCGACAHELAAWHAMSGLGERAASDSEVDDADVERVLEAVAETTRGKEFEVVPLRPWLGVDWASPGVARASAVVAVTLALAAAILLIVRGRSREPDASHLARASVGTADGLLLDGKPAPVGAEIAAGTLIEAEGRACIDVEGGVRACLERGSLARFADAAFAHRVMELRSGAITATLAHQRPGTTFSVETAAGSATAVGTVYSVELVDPSKPAVVRVEEGVVVVRGRNGVETRVAAREQTAIGSAKVTSIGPRADTTGTLSAFEPITASAAGGTPSPTATATSIPPPAETSTSSTISKNDSTPGPRPPPSPPGPQAPSAAELLSNARALRSLGKLRESAEAYGQLEATYSDSAEAHAALVSLGDLELSLGDGAAALEAYDAYVAKGGALAEEAGFGRIEALRLLGKASEERRAIASFLKSYPSTLHAEALRARATALGGGP
jgi:hypothetical protein